MVPIMNLKLSSFLLILLATIAETQDATTQDKNEWIPINNPAQEAPPQKATARVLNIAEPPDKNFFPEDANFRRKQNQQINNYNQFLLETLNPQRQQKKLQVVEPYTFESILPQQNLPKAVPSPVAPAQVYQLEDLLALNQQNQQIIQNVPSPVTKQQFIAQQKIPQLQTYLLQEPYHQLSHPQFYQPNQLQITIPTNTTLLHPGIEAINSDLTAFKEKPSDVSHIDITAPPKVEKENVQLLYVPVETLTQQIQRQPQHRKQKAQVEQMNLNHPTHKEFQLKGIEHDFIKQALEAHRIQQQLQSQPLALPIVVSTTTPKPITTKKRKAHQPPLAVYMGTEGEVQISDVLSLLKDAKSIDVQDNVGPNSPHLFIGPSNLNAPNGFAKFELPYLSNIDSNRVERKVDQLPFFVAPLSYKTPNGYSKIPLPSPHVGSVVVSHKTDPQIATTTQLNVIDLSEATEDTHAYRKRKQAPRGPSIQRHKQRQNYYEQPEYVLVDTPNLYDQLPQKQQQNYQGPEHLYASIQQQQQHQVQQIQNEFLSSLFEPPQVQNTETIQPQVDHSSQSVYHQNRPQPEPVHTYISRGHTSTPATPVETATRSNSLDQTINHYELQQINNGFLPVQNIYPQTERSQVRFLDTNHEAIPQLKSAKTANARTNDQRRRQKPTERVAVSTEAPVDINNYRVLEEFRVTPEAAIAHNQNIQVKKPEEQRRRQKPTERVVVSTEVPIAINNYRVLEEFQVSKPETTNNQNFQVKKQEDQRRRQRPTERVVISTEVPIENSNYRVLEEVKKQDPIETFLTQFSPAQQQPSITSQNVQISPATRPVYSNFPADVNQQQFLQTIGYQRDEPKVQAPPERTEPVKIKVIQESGNVAKVTKAPEKYDYVDVYDIPNPTAIHRPIQQSVHNIASIQNQNVQQKSKINEDSSAENPFLPSLINNLQDQAIRPLLIPALIAPTTAQSYLTPGRYELTSPQQPKTIPSSPKPIEYVSIVTPQKSVATSAIYTTPSTTPEYIYIPSTTQQVETTTRKSRGRQRGSSRYSVPSSSSNTNSPRRNSQQRTRRPTSRPKYTQPSVVTSSDYSSVKINRYSTEETPRRTTTSSARQMVRGRSRIVKHEVTEKPSTLKPTPSEVSYQISTPTDAYAQYEKQQVIIVPKLQTREQIQNLQQNYKQEEIRPEEYFNRKLNVEISSPSSQLSPQQEIISHPTGDEQFVQYTANIGPVNIISVEPKPEITSRAPARIRGRTRIKAKYTTPAATTSTTTRTTTTTEKYVAPEEESQEFYGFFRAPSFQKPPLPQEQISLDYYERAPLYAAGTSATLGPLARSSNALVEADEEIDDAYTSTTPVRFIGEIRPKYQSSTVQYVNDVTSAETYTVRATKQTSTEAPKARTRVRMRVPSRRKQTNDEVEEYSTRRSAQQRGRTRGKTQFRTPEQINAKREEDVEGGNYPGNFYKTQEQPTPRALFQITVDPTSEEDAEDQLPYSSIIRPKILRKSPEENLWSELPLLNDIPVEIKGETTETTFETASTVQEITTPSFSTISEDTVTTTVLPTTDAPTPKPSKGRRRGVWRKVKKTSDVFETAESQNYAAININSFIAEVKTKTPSHKLATTTEAETTATPATPTTQHSFFDTLYEMFGMAEMNRPNDTNSQTVKKNLKPMNAPLEIVTTYSQQETTESAGQTSTETPVFPEEYKEITSAPVSGSSLQENNSIESELETTTALTTSKAWEPSTIAFVKTSTSTEITHETEICYKGRCVRSTDNKSKSS